MYALKFDFEQEFWSKVKILEQNHITGERDISWEEKVMEMIDEDEDLDEEDIELIDEGNHER